MNELIKSYIDFRKNVIGIENPKTFIQTYRWAKKNGHIWHDIADYDDNYAIKFSVKYDETIFMIGCNYSDGRVGEVLITSCYKKSDPSVIFGCDATERYRFESEVDWERDLQIPYALNRHWMGFENCSGITELIFIPCNETGMECYDMSADYICFNKMHEKIGYVFVISCS